TNLVNSKEPLAYYVSLALIKPHQSNGGFLRHLITSVSVQKEIWSKTLHIAFPKKINKNEIGKLKMYLPDNQEQKKITKLMNYLDFQITLHQKRANKLMSVRQEFLNKIFEIHTDCELRLRFNSFNDKWNKVSLGAVGKTQSGIGFPDSEQGGEVGIPFFKVSDMNKPGNEYEMLNANNYVSEEQVELRNLKPIEDLPAIMFAKVGAAIFLNRKRIIRTPFLIDNNTMAYIFDKNWDPIFGKTLFDTINLAKYAQVGALPSYNSKDIESIVVYIPNLNEQIKVGKFFKEIDVIIEKNKDIINRLNVIKTSYLHKIFL